MRWRVGPDLETVAEPGIVSLLAGNRCQVPLVGDLKKLGKLDTSDKRVGPALVHLSLLLVFTSGRRNI